MNKAINTLIKVYQRVFSDMIFFLFGRGCRFAPTCSEYARQAFGHFSPIKASFLSLKRLAKCHPFGGSGYDPI